MATHEGLKALFLYFEESSLPRPKVLTERPRRMICVWLAELAHASDADVLAAGRALVKAGARFWPTLGEVIVACPSMSTGRTWSEAWAWLCERLSAGDLEGIVVEMQVDPSMASAIRGCGGLRALTMSSVTDYSSRAVFRDAYEHTRKREHVLQLIATPIAGLLSG